MTFFEFSLMSVTGGNQTEVFLMAEYRKLKRAIIKEELVSLTGDFKQAIVLNQFIYWSERVKDSKRFMEEEVERGRKFSDGSVETPEDISESLMNGWIYKTADEMIEEVMLTISKTTMQRIIDSLVDKEWLSRRRNPKYQWDKTYQYRLNLNKLQTDLLAIGFALEGYSLQEEKEESPKVQNESSRVQNESSRVQNESSRVQNEPAIPEITSKGLNTIDTKDTKDTKSDLSEKSSRHEAERQRKRKELMEKAYRENATKIPEKISEVLNIFCNTENQRTEYYKAMIVAKKNAEQFLNINLTFEDIPTLAEDMSQAFIRAIRKIENSKKKVDNPTGYIYTSVYQMLCDYYRPNQYQLTPEDENDDKGIQFYKHWE